MKKLSFFAVMPLFILMLYSCQKGEFLANVEVKIETDKDANLAITYRLIRDPYGENDTIEYIEREAVINYWSHVLAVYRGIEEQIDLEVENNDNVDVNTTISIYYDGELVFSRRTILKSNSWTGVTYLVKHDF